MMNFVRVGASCAFAAFAIGVFPVAKVQAAGFDCRYAKSHVEKLICADSELSRFDSQLKDLFLKAQSETSGRNGETGAIIDPIGDEQRKWRETVRDLCSTTTCLRRVYTARIREVREKWSDALQ